MQPGNSPATASRRRFLRAPRLSDLVTVLLLIALGVGILSILPADYYMLLPGEARSVGPMIHVDGYPALHTGGTLYMTDVTIYKVDHKLEELYGRINPNADLEPAQSVAPGLSEKQYLRLNVGLMTDSIQQAEIAALSALHRFRLRCADLKPQIQYILPHTPAASVLKPGDVIDRVNGRSVCASSQVFPLVRNLRPGAVVHALVLRNGRAKSVAIRTIAGIRRGGGVVPNPRGHVAMMGVSMQDAVQPRALHLPVKIRVDPGNTSGPSAGLMFTLGIIERLERRDITHGCKIAGTGTVDYAGNVGPIGGAKQKIIAARHAGARYFLVPDERDNVDPARGHRGDVRVVPVKTVRQALQFLNHIAPCK